MPWLRRVSLAHNSGFFAFKPHTTKSTFVYVCNVVLALRMFKYYKQKNGQQQQQWNEVSMANNYINYDYRSASQTRLP